MIHICSNQGQGKKGPKEQEGDQGQGDYNSPEAHFYDATHCKSQTQQEGERED